MTAKMPPLVPNLTQFALRFAVVSDTPKKSQPIKLMPFQSALRFAVVSDLDVSELPGVDSVSIRSEVRGGFRRTSGEATRLRNRFNPL